MTSSQKRQCESIISNAKIKAGAVGSNFSLLSTILTDMVVEIGKVFGYNVRNNIPSDLKVEIFSYTLGSSANRLLTSWIPGVGKVVNHASAAMVTEEVGSHAIEYFNS